MEDIIKHIETQYDFKILEYRRLTGGLVNTVWHLKTNKGDKIQRQILSTRSDAEIAFEYEYIELLAAHDIPVPRVLKTKHDELFSRKELNKYWVQEFLPGRIEQLDEHKLYTIGKMMKKMHQIAGNFQPKNATNRNQIFEKKKRKKWLQKELTADTKHKKNLKVLKESHDLILTILNKPVNKYYSQQPRIAIHEDIWRNNLLWKNSELTGIVDFDNATMDSPLADLAILIGSECDEKGMLTKKRVQAVIRGYQDSDRLTDTDRELLIDMILHFCIEATLFLHEYHRTKETIEPESPQVENCIRLLQQIHNNRSEVIEMLR